MCHENYLFREARELRAMLATEKQIHKLREEMIRKEQEGLHALLNGNVEKLQRKVQILELLQSLNKEVA